MRLHPSLAGPAFSLQLRSFITEKKTPNYVKNS
jgi:hypothetical protein